MTKLEHEFEKTLEQTVRRFDRLNDLQKGAVAENAAYGDYYKERAPKEKERIRGMSEKGMNQILQKRNEWKDAQYEVVNEIGVGLASFHSVATERLISIDKRIKQKKVLATQMLDTAGISKTMEDEKKWNPELKPHWKQ